MNQIITEYLDWKGTYAPKACINYKIWLNYLVKVCGEKPLKEYGIADLVKFHSWLEERFNPCSVQYGMLVFKNFLKYCKNREYPCLSPEMVKLPRVVAKSHRAIKEEEYVRIISEIPIKKFINLRDLILVRLLWDTGVRVSELCDLDVSQIDERKCTTIIQTKKTGKKRIIVWSAETHKLLMEYMTQRMSLRNVSNQRALFMGCTKGKDWSMRMTKRSVERIVRYYSAKAGIKEKITPHSFRHGWAHYRRDRNAPLAFIQKGLGHANPISTFVYEQYCDSDFEKNANSFLQAA